MRQFKSIFIPLTLFLFLFSTLTNAQTTQTVTPAKATQSANEIKDIFGDLIGVSVTEIEDFYNHHWSSSQPYNPSALTPKAALTNIDNSNIDFDWSLSPGSPPSNGFRISALRLSDGTTQSTSTMGNSTTLDLEKSIFLVIFQTNYGSYKSALDIIIIERIMFLTDGHCDCRNFQEIFTQSFHSGSEIPMHLWQPNNNSNQYFYEIFYTYPEGLYASFKAEIDFYGNTPIIIHLDESSMNNFYLNADETFIHAQDGDFGEFLGPVTFSQNPEFPNESDPVISYYPASFISYQRGTIKLSECRDRERGEENIIVNHSITSDKIVFKEVSNSFVSNKTIEYQLPSDQNLSIYLLDNQGRLIKTITKNTNKESGSYQQDLDLSPYPNGTYFCILKTKSETASLKLLKTN